MISTSPPLHRASGCRPAARVWRDAPQRVRRAIICSTVLPTLDFLPAGRSEKSAADLIDDSNVEWFLREAGARYSYVLMDSAPNLAVPDPLILGRAVQGVLYVIKAGSTIRKAAEYGVRVQREACDNVVGVLMNDLCEILPHYYGYHEAYGKRTTKRPRTLAPMPAPRSARLVGPRPGRHAHRRASR
jgi:Mrp family chromosome partitioning ATPase